MTAWEDRVTVAVEQTAPFTMHDTPFPAVLLLGPTGSGKTPLGRMLEQRGLDDRHCVHFDFGENLRQVVRRATPDDIVSRQDIQFLRGVLERGALLEDKDFPIAERILRDFVQRRRVGAETIVVLNGLPRHAGQASAIERMLAVEVVVCLECSPETVFRRIRDDSGGDRAGRIDDDLLAVTRKLAIFHQRTTPLVRWYRNRGVRVVQIPITQDTSTEAAWTMLCRELAAGRS
ncbi:MAG: nucleoside monophosphate kinase [Planctomycetes bacterium]|nr:nucleoside monophosphate kinase [Planctomycetota bacterium]